MTGVRRRLIATLFATALASAQFAPLRAADEPTIAALFDDGVVHEIHLWMHAGDWARLQEHYLENTYYPADFDWNGHVVRNVGIRSRGTGSRDPGKPGIKVDFNEFVKGQSFVGLGSLALDNFRQDPSMMKESLSMQLFAKMGVPAPRVSHARVYINNDYLGLYAVIEPVEKPFLLSRWNEDDGYLYEFEWSGAYHFEWLGTDPMRYAPMFAAKTHESHPPERLYGTLVAMITTANRSSRHTWEPEMGRYVDFDALLTYVAVEQFLSDHDGLAGDWGLNNFYGYRFQDSDRFQFIPWDKDVNFREVDRDVFAGLDENVLLGTAMTYSRLRDRYIAALRRVAATAADSAPSTGSMGWLEREVVRLANLIRTSAHADPSKAWTNERFEQEVAWLQYFARHRSGHVFRQVGQ